MRKNLKTRIGWKLSVALAGILAVSVFALPAGNVNAEEEEKPWMSDDYVGGYYYDEEEENATPVLSGSAGHLRFGLPDSYDAREHGQVTSVKDQGGTESCWAFATSAAMESALLSRGIYADVNTSELHTVRYTFTQVDDPLGGFNDEISYKGTNRMKQPCNVIAAYHTLAGWRGAVDEAYAPFPDTPYDNDFSPSTEDAFSGDVLHLHTAYRINTESTDDVKKAIMDYGAVTASFYWKRSFYNSSTWAYYSGPDNTQSSNHAICFVGWDDNFSRTNFNIDPGMDGAWLIKNSWGTDEGDEGFQWISYAEKSIGSTCCVILAEPADDYEYCYQYDETNISNIYRASEEVTLANIFQVKGDEQAEEVKAVSFELLSAETSYEIQIYGKLKDLSNPSGGVPMLSTPVTGVTTYAGYYTVDLPEGIKLKKGSYFSVVITLKKDGDVRYLTDCSDTAFQTVYTAHASEFQSMRYNKTTGKWQDFGKNNDVNLRIKAFTTKTEMPEESPFSDITDMNSWQYKAAKFVYDKGIMGGKGMVDDKVVFAPNAPLTRSEFVRVLYNYEGTPAVTYRPVFTDVPEGKWFTNGIMWAEENGIVKGKGSIFDVSGNATREELAVMFIHYGQYKGYDVSVKEGEGPDYDSFTDKDLVSSWAVNSFKWALSRGIMTGKNGKLDPKGKATRAECATMIKNFIQAYTE